MGAFLRRREVSDIPYGAQWLARAVNDVLHQASKRCLSRDVHHAATSHALSTAACS